MLFQTMFEEVKAIHEHSISDLYAFMTKALDRD